MTQQHHITPPPELVASMIEQAFNPLGATGLSDPDQLTGAFADLVTRAAQYGADHELEECLSYAGDQGLSTSQMRNHRRPKAPSLKEQALEELSELSPAAEAVLDAYRSSHLSINNLAAALRAAADQVVPPALEEEWRDRNQALPLTKMVEIRLKLLAIAAELEAQ
jgi:hypothetical protein